MKRKLGSATTLAFSVNEMDDILLSMKAEMPRIVLSEFNTHRVFGRNSASSRAIPAKKAISRVETNGFIPFAYQKEHTGMQGSSYFQEEIETLEIDDIWKDAMKDAIKHSTRLMNKGVTKQLSNRLLEPFMWHTVIVTSSEWTNFHTLRAPKYLPVGSSNSEVTLGTRPLSLDLSDGIDLKTYLKFAEINKSFAEIHIQDVSENILRATYNLKPELVREGEYHNPFPGKFDENELDNLIGRGLIKNIDDGKILVGVARCARISYDTFDGNFSHEEDVKLALGLFKNGHLSPAEHVAMAMDEEDYNNWAVREGGNLIKGVCRNFTGFFQERVLREPNFMRK